MRYRGLCSRISYGFHILDKAVTKPLWMDGHHAGQMLNRCDDVQTKHRDRSRCYRGDHKSYVACIPPQPRAGPWHRHTAGDDGFLRPRPHFRGQYRPGCSDKHSGAVSVNPIPAWNSISQLVLLCLVSKPSPTPDPKSASSMAPYRNRNSPWLVSCLGLPILSEPGL